MFFSVNVLFCFVFCLCITPNCDDGNSDFDNQSISRMKSNRPADENVVVAINAILELPKKLKAMPMTIARGSDDAIERAKGMNVQGILEREFKSLWDLGKIPGLKKAFSNNVQQVKRAPDMVRDFYSQAKRIILEIYHAFADEEEQKKIEGELNEGDSTSKEKDKKEGNEAEGANGGSIKVKLRKVSPTRKRTKRSFIRS